MWWFLISGVQEKVKIWVEKKMTVGVAKLRLLPRTGGIRMIENMGSHLNLPFVQVIILAIRVDLVATRYH